MLEASVFNEIRFFLILCMSEKFLCYALIILWDRGWSCSCTEGWQSAAWGTASGGVSDYSCRLSDFSCALSDYSYALFDYSSGCLNTILKSARSNFWIWPVNFKFWILICEIWLFEFWNTNFDIWFFKICFVHWEFCFALLWSTNSIFSFYRPQAKKKQTSWKYV